MKGLSNKGYTKIAEMIVQKSIELNMDLNARSKDGETAFICACRKEQSKIVEMLMQKGDRRFNHPTAGFVPAECTSIHNHTQEICFVDASESGHGRAQMTPESPGWNPNPKGLP